MQDATWGPSAGDGQELAGGGGEEDPSLSIEAGPAAGQVTLTHHALHGGSANLAAYEVRARRGLPAIAFGCCQCQAEVYPAKISVTLAACSIPPCRYTVGRALSLQSTFIHI